MAASSGSRPATRVSTASGRERDVAPGEYVCIDVIDTGTGMTPDVMARAFDPFFTTKPTGQGTGLGLSMIYGFARQSDGYVKIASEVGQGTTVSLYLPRHDAVEDVPANAEQAAPAHHRARGQTVLVVEDEPLVRLLIIDLLRRAGLQGAGSQRRADRPAHPALRRSGSTC